MGGGLYGLNIAQVPKRKHPGFSSTCSNVGQNGMRERSKAEKLSAVQKVESVSHNTVKIELNISGNVLSTVSGQGKYSIHVSEHSADYEVVKVITNTVAIWMVRTGFGLESFMIFMLGASSLILIVLWASSVVFRCLIILADLH